MTTAFCLAKPMTAQEVLTLFNEVRAQQLPQALECIGVVPYREKYLADDNVLAILRFPPDSAGKTFRIYAIEVVT
jgi:hypothetical protein